MDKKHFLHTLRYEEYATLEEPITKTANIIPNMTGEQKNTGYPIPGQKKMEEIITDDRTDIGNIPVSKLPLDARRRIEPVFLHKQRRHKS